MSHILKCSTNNGEEYKGEVHDWSNHDARLLPIHHLQYTKKITRLLDLQVILHKSFFVFMKLIPSTQHKKCDITKKVFIYTGFDMAIVCFQLRNFSSCFKTCSFYICMVLNWTFLLITGIVEYFSLDQNENTPQLFKNKLDKTCDNSYYKMCRTLITTYNISVYHKFIIN